MGPWKLKEGTSEKAEILVREEVLSSLKGPKPARIIKAVAKNTAEIWARMEQLKLV